MSDVDVLPHRVASEAEWLEARRELLQREKALTRAYDELMRERRRLPWIRIEKPYVFQGPEGAVSLADLFDGRSQLIVKHFMLAPGWGEGCPGCSFGVDHVGGALVHLENHDVSYVAVARAPLPEIEAYKQRMGWEFRWVSSFESDFNFDFHVSFTEEDKKRGKIYYNYQWCDFMSEEMSGFSVFYKDPEGNIFHTYSTYGRGDEGSLTAYAYLDLTPMGRNENGPYHNLMDWVKRHDQYPKAAANGDSSCGCSS